MKWYSFKLYCIGEGYVIVTVRDIIANAKIIGTNSALSNIKEVLPAINTDFIVTNLIYTFGWLAFIGLIALVLLFIVKSTKVSLNQKKSTWKACIYVYNCYF